MTFTGALKHPKVAIISLSVVAILLLAIGIVYGVGNETTDDLINESATIDEEILHRGTVYTPSRGGLVRIEEYGVIIGIADAGRDSDLKPGARLSFVSSTNTSIGRNEWVPLGESLTVAGLGTVYVVELSSFGRTQQVSVLYIPES